MEAMASKWLFFSFQAEQFALNSWGSIGIS
jgi:hypothetical protein